MSRTLLIAALAVVSLFAVPTIASAQVDAGEAADFTEQFVRDNAGDLVRGTAVQRVRSLGCIDTSTADEDSSECAFIATLQRRRSGGGTCSDPVSACPLTAATLAGAAKTRAPVRRATRWVCIGVVSLVATTDPVDEGSDFDGEFAFEDCVRVRTRTRVQPI